MKAVVDNAIIAMHINFDSIVDMILFVEALIDVPDESLEEHVRVEICRREAIFFSMFQLLCATKAETSISEPHSRAVFFFGLW